jgi:hypothetical protein
MKLGLMVIAAAFLLQDSNAFADAYSCAKKVYENGWLRKYDYKGQTWGAGTKKSGVTSSTIHLSTENVTSSVDPGVTTGQYMSSTEYSSSWGECSMVDMEIARQFRDDYIDQNLHEIKKQIAIGDGYHLESLATLSGCKGENGATWKRTLQSHTGELYDVESGREFSDKLDTIIQHQQELNAVCRPPLA